ncbi:hypothetical protein HETIRDRAFT_407630 [Heterobasidion irregulare TC 32-1]|uniref:hydroxyacylglutathione hydrolase n=1 Tax=Heterobasidion irregulare (strain TC 32-1) TaxID=747525 RepID=W4KIN7_HETIT|nr:uncharacterized protein HETIRDRAFT_407630 [Heterobasidion irregulare TC 32-1]ETW85712.1 hypothetical protein HETIRDRAFT_407630 [Heterobasidion irregulare TC 32-1]
MRVLPIPVREDNYAYLLIDNTSKKAAVVDPYSFDKVKAAADQYGVQIVAVITTHHHFDHSGGNEQFAKAFPDVPIYGGSDQVKAVTKLVKDKDEFTIGDSITVKCLATPCHTQDSICYYVTDAKDSAQRGVFTGDTLFIAGCGRFFEGTGAEMHAALSYLGTLPDDTLVYNGHEYTASNVKFARSVDPANSALSGLFGLLTETKMTTGLTTIKDEKLWNPFMRLSSEPIRKATKATEDASLGAIMDELRNLKNNFKG